LVQKLIALKFKQKVLVFRKNYTPKFLGCYSNHIRSLHQNEGREHALKCRCSLALVSPHELPKATFFNPFVFSPTSSEKFRHVVKSFVVVPSSPPPPPLPLKLSTFSVCPCQKSNLSICVSKCIIYAEFYPIIYNTHTHLCHQNERREHALKCCCSLALVSLHDLPKDTSSDPFRFPSARHSYQNRSKIPSQKPSLHARLIQNENLKNPRSIFHDPI
jgi:hypothetical protein